MTGQGTKENPYVPTTWEEIVLAASEDGAYTSVQPNTVIDMLEVFPSGIITVPVLEIHNAQFDGNGLILKNLYGEIPSNVSSAPIIRAQRSTSGSPIGYVSGVKLINFYIINTKGVPLVVAPSISSGTVPYYVFTDMEYRGCMFVNLTGQYVLDSTGNYNNYGRHFKSSIVMNVHNSTANSNGIKIMQKWESCFLHFNVNGGIQGNSTHAYLSNSYLEGNCKDNNGNTSMYMIGINGSICSVFNVNGDKNGYDRNNQIYSNGANMVVINEDKINSISTSWNVNAEVHKFSNADIKSYDALKGIGFPIVQEVSP